MKHSKQLTVLLAMLLVLLIFGIVLYLYLSTLNQVPEQVVVDESAVEEVETPELTEQEIRARLEAVMGAQADEPTAASTTETINRLNAVMKNSEPTDSEAVKARLEAVMNKS